MNHDLLKELPELYVLGALPEQERRALKAHLLTCLDCAAAVRDLQRLTEALGSLVEPIDPPAGLRDRVLSVALKEAQEPAQPEFSFLLAGDGWQRHAVPGVTFKELRFERATGQATLLLTLEPGTRFPNHRHSGPEQCLVLSGDIKAGPHRLGPGDFHYAGSGSVHEEVSSEHGCTILLVVAADDYFGHSEIS